jgi:hypothetical protein
MAHTSKPQSGLQSWPYNLSSVPNPNLTGHGFAVSGEISISTCLGASGFSKSIQEKVRVRQCLLEQPAPVVT